MIPPTPWRHTLAALALCQTLTGCAFHYIDKADAGRPAAPGRVVVEGRINYIIDGVSKAPYGELKPRWPAPRFTAIHLDTGETHVSPMVADEDGRFRWQFKPGAYVLTRIGVGNFTDDTYEPWPGVALCVPEAAGPLQAGHLRLEGRSFDETVTLSTGTTYRSRGVRYRVEVDAEAADGSPSTGVPRFQVRRELPAGERFFEWLRTDRQRLLNEACGRD